MADENKEELEMSFDPNTISHLGLQMYSTLPPVIAELVSNSYDADAHKVTLTLNDSDSSNKTISIEDDGHGMTFNEINNCFLLIGRNRREGDKKNQKTRSGERFVIGKKGIGKLPDPVGPHLYLFLGFLSGNIQDLSICPGYVRSRLDDESRLSDPRLT